MPSGGDPRHPGTGVQAGEDGGRREAPRPEPLPSGTAGTPAEARPAGAKGVVAPPQAPDAAGEVQASKDVPEPDSLGG